MVQHQILGLITPMMAAVFVAVFLIMWKRGRMGRYVLAFAGAYLFFGLGSLATHLIAETGATYGTLPAHLLYSLGGACAAWGVASRVGQSLSLPTIGYIYGVSAIALAATTSVSTAADPQLYIVNTGYGLIFVLGTVAMLQANRRYAIDLLVVVLFAMLATQLFLSPVLPLLIPGEAGAPGDSDSVYDSVVSLAVTVQALVTAVTLVGACAWDQVVAERERAVSDALTGLRARRAFEQDAFAVIERSKQEGVPVSLVVADIDNFKSVNDLYGHQVGDNGIAAFGRVISGMIRNSDVAGRIGGEEFCILAWNCDLAQAETMADRIRRRLCETAVAGLVNDVHLTASFGVAGRLEDEGYGKLFARADAALYRAKQAGRNRVCASYDDPAAAPADSDGGAADRSAA